MKKRIPPLNWLRSFEASARHLSFTHAAYELNMTQAAISLQIKNLEAQLGAELFKRLPRGLDLTDAGAAYLPAVHESVTKISEATEDLFGQNRNNLLTVRVNLVYFMHCLADKIGQFRQLYPHVNLRITSNIWVDSQHKSADADLEIRHGNGRWSQLKSHRLTWDDLFPVCSPSYYQQTNKLEAPHDLIYHNLLHVIGYEDGWSHFFNKIGLKNIEISQGFQFDTLIVALEMAAQGEGIALARTSLVQKMLTQGRLITLFDNRVSTLEAFYLVYSKQNKIHPHAELFKNWLLKISK